MKALERFFIGRSGCPLSVLEAIQTLGLEGLVKGKWLSDGKPCVMLVAAATVAQQTPVRFYELARNARVDIEAAVAQALGLERRVVNAIVKQWDGAGDKRRSALLRDITTKLTRERAKEAARVTAAAMLEKAKQNAHRAVVPQPGRAQSQEPSVFAWLQGAQQQAALVAM